MFVVYATWFFIFQRSSLPPCLPLHMHTRTFYAIVPGWNGISFGSTPFALHSKSWLFFRSSFVVVRFQPATSIRLYLVCVCQIIFISCARMHNTHKAERNIWWKCKSFLICFFFAFIRSPLVRPNVSHFNSSCFFCMSFDCHSIHLRGARQHSIESIPTTQRHQCWRCMFFFATQFNTEQETHRNKRALFTLSNVSAERKMKRIGYSICFVECQHIYPFYSPFWRKCARNNESAKKKEKEKRERREEERDRKRESERVAKSKVATSAFLWK